MESGKLTADDPAKSRPDAWKPFATDPGTAHFYLADGPKQDNRILRVIGGSFGGKTVDGGYVQRVSGLSHAETYRLSGRIRSSWPVDVEHVCYVGYDLTGQDKDPKAETVIWTALPSVHSIFVSYLSDPVRPKTEAISVWLRGWTKSTAAAPFKADFDDFALRRVQTGVPGKPARGS